MISNYRQSYSNNIVLSSILQSWTSIRAILIQGHERGRLSPSYPSHVDSCSLRARTLIHTHAIVFLIPTPNMPLIRNLSHSANEMILNRWPPNFGFGNDICAIVVEGAEMKYALEELPGAN